MAFILNAAVGLLLHFFTNMFTVTAILGSAAAVWANFKKIEAVVNTVHGEISHAGIIMDHLKTSLTRRILELSHAEKKSERKALLAAASNSKIPEAANFADFDEGGDGMIQVKIQLPVFCLSSVALLSLFRLCSFSFLSLFCRFSVSLAAAVSRTSSWQSFRAGSTRKQSFGE